MININRIRDDYHYKKWYEKYEKDVRVMFNKMISLLESQRILYKEYDFESFCRRIYNKSSKRIVE